MQRRTKRHAKNLANNNARRKSQHTNGFGSWLTSRPGADLSLLLSKVRAAQVRRLHFR